MSKIPSFEILLGIVDSLQPSASEADREVRWCDEDAVVGFSRQANGAIEIFIVGQRLLVRSATLRRHLRFDNWMRSSGDAFAASRLVLPAAEYFAPTAAFVAEELFRAGVVDAPNDAFLKCEPIIEMLLRREALSDDLLRGLLGELFVLESALIAAYPLGQAAGALQAWCGFLPALRDFEFAQGAVEVKTTRTLTSTHKMGHILQGSPRVSDSGVALEQLYLISIGFVASDQTTGWCLANQVDNILARLGANVGSPNELQRHFLSSLEKYGGTEAGGYIHSEMRTWPVYQQCWARSFTRIYDMGDQAIKVLRPIDVSGRTNTPIGSIRFSVEFPEKVNGDINPQTDILVFLAGMV